MGPMISKEMKYNLHYGDVRGDILPPPHATVATFSTLAYDLEVKVTEILC